MAISKLHKFRLALFWRLFTNYFIVILVPVIVASFLAHVLAVRTIEKDAEKLNDVVISHFSKQTDTALDSLKTNMINMLSSSNLTGVLRVIDDSRENQQRAEQFHALREQLMKLQSDKLVSKVFLYFANRDLVADVDIYTDKSYYFKMSYPLGDQQKRDYLSRFTGKKMMDITDSSSLGMYAVMSYPFNTENPEVYLVVHFDQDKLKEQISIPEKWVTGTAIATSQGEILNQNGLTEREVKAVLAHTRANAMSSQFLVTDEIAMSLVKSRFNDSWYYVTIADLRTLMKPAYITRVISWAFLVFFLVVGSFVSYYLSRRWYRPVQEITEENKELSQRMSGMVPLMQELFVTKILQGEYKDELSIAYYAKEIDFSYDKHAMRTVLCIAFHYNSEVYEKLSETTKSFMFVEIKELIRKSTPSMVWFCQTKPDMMACVVTHDAFLHLGADEAADVAKLVLESYSQYFKATIGIGKTVNAAEELHESYDQALSVLQNRGLDADVEICRGPLVGERTQWESFLSVQEVNRIFNQCKTREYDKLLESVCEKLEEGRHKNATAMQVKYLCTDVLNTWIRAVETEHNDFNVPFFSSLYVRLHSVMTWDELKQCFVEIHRVLFRTEEPDQRTKQFSEILAYIHDHYNEELSIEYFAGLLNMSSGHFSRTFKEAVGEKYVEYIAKYRLMKAKQFLLETDMKIDEIAEKVGYWGRNSFIRTFRKYEGITPAKYRSMDH
ncbi:helix-turn-helix domain-containing protein [Paenibacillus planticolens]|uniref:Helix-turn-helix domain-containing protein n=1 Tax=Paenibacillus planticolens TaxID=2654976 RepID=A0ABX1ZTH7_9BACL|nr:helix-turn-helix domain-containing protein [Paenibacillus planticolens]NOV02149.1 helix-turn-helix domain-containing protein [Paenibacillus planticolens]